MSEKKRPMTLKMGRFADLYLESRNATRSYAIAFGYNPDDPKQKEDHYNSWSVGAHNLLKDERVAEYLEVNLRELDRERDLTEKEIIMQLNRIALGGHFKENTRMEALKTLVRIKGMTDDSPTQQSVNINLSSDLSEAVTENTDKLWEPGEE